MRIQAYMEQIYRETGCAVFVPEQFIDEGLGAEEDVLVVLRDLEADGDLRGYATIRCAEGHDFFGGSPELVASCHTRECDRTDCPTVEYSDEELADEALQPRVLVRYALSRRYRSCIDSGGQKKTPPSLPRS